MQKTTAHIFAQTLKEIGVRYVFGVPSGSMVDYIEAIRTTDGIDFILTTHEAGAAFMAGVCGRLTGVPGACFATFGPGATNLGTGVGAALLDRAPLMAFTDEMPEQLRHRTVQMNINHQALFAPLTKATGRLSPENTRQLLFEFADIAENDVPGPVHIGVPSDISRSEANNVSVPTTRGLTSESSQKNISQLTQKISHHLSRTKKPVLALGLSAARPDIKPGIISFLDRFRMPVVLTPMAKGLVHEDHPCYAGVLNHALSHRVAQTHSRADLVIGIGYDPVEVNYEDWVLNQPIIHIDRKIADVDPDQVILACNIEADITTVLKALENIAPPEFDWDFDTLEKTKTQMFTDLASKPDVFGPAKVLEPLRQILPQDGILTCDVGAHLHLIGQKWPTPAPNTLLMTNGWSSMGFAVPAAIAAKLSRPDKQVACVVGDGGFLMTAGELATALRLNLDIVFVLLADQDLSLIRLKQDQKELAPGYATRISKVNLFDATHIFGVPVFTVRTGKQCKSALEKAFHTQGPVIINALVDAGEYDDLLLKGNQPA